MLSRSQPQFAEVPFLSMSACAISSHKDDSPIGCNCGAVQLVQLTDQPPATVTHYHRSEPHQDEGSAFAEPSANGRLPCNARLPDKHRHKRIPKAPGGHYEQIKHVPSIRRINMTGIFPMLCIGKPPPVPAGLSGWHTSRAPACCALHKIAFPSVHSVRIIHCHLLPTGLRIWRKHDVPKSQCFCGCQKCHTLVRRAMPMF
jgi:hypothetical protein